MFDGLKRVESGFVKDLPDETSVCEKDFMVVVPVRFSKVGFCLLGSVVKVLANFAVVDSTSYKVYLIPCFIEISPYKTETYIYQEQEYYLFHMRKGQKFTDNRVMVNDGVIKPLIEETIMKGNIPWYYGYQDPRELLDKLKFYLGSNITEDKTLISIFVSLVARTPASYEKGYRFDPKGLPQWVGLYNNALSRSEGFDQMTGAYMRDGLTSAARREYDNPTDLEKIIK